MAANATVARRRRPPPAGPAWSGSGGSGGTVMPHMLLDSDHRARTTSGGCPTPSSTRSPSRSASSSSTPCPRPAAATWAPTSGAVELTLALHRVFDSPRDILLWDTGHQAYVHKILTGRAAGFATLRQAGGLSGYPSRAESEHDWIENSHASTIVSYAHGLAMAQEARGRRGPPGRGRDRRRLDDRRHGVRGPEQPRPLGQQGDHHPQRQRPVLRPHRLEARREPRPPPGQPELPAATGPASTGSSTRSRCVGDQLEQSLDGFVAAMRELFEPPAFFETSACATRARSTATTSRAWRGRCATPPSYDGPIVVHVVTQKGRGYAPAENDPVKRLHDIGPTLRSPAATPPRSPRR